MRRCKQAPHCSSPAGPCRSWRTTPSGPAASRSSEVSQRPDILFEDFEHGYDNWKVQGEAFGKEPARGTLPNQNPVSGFLGQGLVNTFLDGDDTTGPADQQATSPSSAASSVSLSAAGITPNTQIRLMVNGKVVRAASGKDNERLESGFVGRAPVRGPDCPHRDRG